MSSNRKVYARQVPWEWQESPWDDEQLKTDKAALYGRFFYLAANDIHHAACAGFAETGNSIGKLFRCACSEYIAVSQFTHISAWTNGLEYNGTVIQRFVSINYYLA